MKILDIKLDENIIEWLDEINARPNTRKNFIHSMSMYTEFMNMTPDQLLNEADEDALLPIRKRKLKKHLIAFRVFLQERKLSDHTIRSHLTAVKSFYSTNEILLPKIKIDKPKNIKENDQIPTKEDIQDCLFVCDPLEKALMLTGISSGLASNEIRNLKLEQFKSGYDPETEITTLSLRREKTKVDFITFLSPEASRAVLEYLAFRDRPVKNAGVRRKAQREKQKTTDNSYLFILRIVPEIYLENHDEEIRKIGQAALEYMYRQISEKARKNTKTGYNFIRSHTMRKYFNSALLNTGCDSFHVEFWMGHQLSETQAAYFRANIQAQKELYKKYAPYLVIEKSLDVAASHEYQSLEEENEKLKAENETLHVERYEYRMLEKRIEAEKIKNNINILKLQMKIHPENAERIQKAINDLQNILEKM